MTLSKFVEHLDHAPAHSNRDNHVDTSGRGRTTSDSSAGSKSPESNSPSDERVYRDRFPSPKRTSMDSPTDSPTRRRLRRLTLRKDS
jgi:hypothetical protein